MTSNLTPVTRYQLGSVWYYVRKEIPMAGHVPRGRINPLFSVVIPFVLIEAARKALDMPDAPVSHVIRAALAHLAPPEVQEQAKVYRGVPSHRSRSVA